MKITDRNLIEKMIKALQEFNSENPDDETDLLIEEANARIEENDPTQRYQRADIREILLRFSHEVNGKISDMSFEDLQYAPTTVFTDEDVDVWLNNILKYGK